jgi:hypothetical protein
LEDAGEGLQAFFSQLGVGVDDGGVFGFDADEIVEVGQGFSDVHDLVDDVAIDTDRVWNVARSQECSSGAGLRASGPFSDRGV